jgi:hypothetical protein
VTPTATHSTTATPSASAATLSLLSPTSGQGPVGAHLTFSGQHWSGTQVKVAATTASTCPSSASADQTLGQAAIAGDGTFTTTIDWPVALASPGTAYLLCATNTGGHGGATAVMARQMYRVRSASAPALSVSLVNPAAGQEVQIEGANFVGVSRVVLMVQTHRGERPLATIVPDPKDGSFVQRYVPVSGDQGGVTLAASSAPDGAAPPALQATRALTVGPPLPPTPTLAATPVSTSSSIIVTSRGGQSGGLGSLGLVILFAVGSLLALLALVGVGAWLLFGGKKPRLAGSVVPPRAPAQAPVGAPLPPPAQVPVGARVRGGGGIGRLWENAPAAADSLGVPPGGMPLAEPAPAGTAPGAPDWPDAPTSGLLRRYREGARGTGNGDGYGVSNGTPSSLANGGKGGGASGRVPAYPGSAGDPRQRAPLARGEAAPAAGDHGARGYGYFGLPSLESPDALDLPDPAGTHPNGRGYPDARE